MATEATAPKGHTTASDSVFPSLGNTDLAKILKGAPEVYAAGWGKVLGFAADRLQDQATYLKQLSQCTDPAEALKLNATFAQQSVSRLWDDGVKVFDGFRASFASGLPEK